ncbi:MAG: hypothetical protein K9J30_12725 [Bacteroidales bacterium]|nr:hypothetical protein [Bacteroidales bacterium]
MVRIRQLSTFIGFCVFFLITSATASLSQDYDIDKFGLINPTFDSILARYCDDAGISFESENILICRIFPQVDSFEFRFADAGKNLKTSLNLLGYFELIPSGYCSLQNKTIIIYGDEIDQFLKLIFSKCKTESLIIKRNSRDKSKPPLNFEPDVYVYRTARQRIDYIEFGKLYILE